jgi:hypothetical protein
MRQHEPLAQVPRRFVRSRAVERHHRGRYARRADDVRTPPVASDSGDLDVIGAAVNEFVEVMHETMPVKWGESHYTRTVARQRWSF